jgi:hypothetical protein
VTAPPVAKAIEAKVAAARAVSQDFNREVVEVRKEQALATLAAAPIEHVEVAAAEREPNDGLLTTNIVALDTWVTGSVGAAKDADYYAFTAPEGPRDWIAVEVKNQSTSLEPRLELFDGEKTSLGSAHKTTAGADVAYRFVAPPKGRFTVRVSSYYGESVGVYALRVAATKAYDAHESNDDILAAKPMEIGSPLMTPTSSRLPCRTASTRSPRGSRTGGRRCIPRSACSTAPSRRSAARTTPRPAARRAMRGRPRARRPITSASRIITPTAPAPTR